MPGTVDGREERELLAAVKKASELVAAGDTPDAAVEKVAREYGFGPGKIRLIGQGYNTGQQLGQWRAGPAAGVLDKLASFPLCDPDAVVARIYDPAEKAAAVSPAYSRPPVLPGGKSAFVREKAAAAPPAKTPLTTQGALSRAYGNIARAKQAAEEASRRAGQATDEVRRAAAALVGYFRKAAGDRLPFSAVEGVAKTYHGPAVGPLMDMTYAGARLKEKRAGDAPPLLRTPADPRAEPFTLVTAAVAAAEKAAALAAVAAEKRAAYATARVEELRPFAAAGEGGRAAPTGEKAAMGIVPEIGAIAAGDILAHHATHQAADPDPYGDVGSLDAELAQIRRQTAAAIGRRRRVRPKAAADKAAFLGVGLGTAIGSSMGRTMGSVGKSKDDMVNDQWLNLEDPEHENELRKIQAHALLNRLMTDPDDPISGHDPDKVLAAYNEISSAAPRVAMNAATLRPALRKRLEGHTEPFESKELLDVEQGLAKTRQSTPSTSIMGKAPDSLLG